MGAGFASGGALGVQSRVEVGWIVSESVRYEAAHRIIAELGMSHWTLHDLRRTAATILDKVAYSLEQIGALLAHTRKSVTTIYGRWDKFNLRREMAMVVEQALRETLADKLAVTTVRTAA